MGELSKFENKEIWYCGNMTRRINFNADTISLCHEAQVGDVVLFKVGDLTPESYYSAVSQVIEKANQDSEFQCRRCSKCKKGVFHFEKIFFVTICTSMYCNSKCIYCTAHFGQENSGYDPVPYLEMFHMQELFLPNCYFDWGGGEPTLNPHYENTVNWLYQRGYYQRFNTNAIIFSQSTFNALKEGKGNVRVSVDSGTMEGYRRVKGTDNYDSVWESINKYCSVSDDVYIKYNICNYNSDKSELDSFIEQCRKNGVKNVVVDGEINSYQPAVNAGPFYFTEKELKAAKYLEKMAKSNGFKVEVGWYAFSVRPEYDSDGKLKLPETYYDNIDRSIVSNGVQVRTFATVDQLLENISNEPDIPIVIWGAGQISDKIRSILKANNISVSYIIDDNNTQSSELVGGVNILTNLIEILKLKKMTNIKSSDISMTTLDKVKNMFDKVHLVLVGANWREKLQKINSEKYMIDGFVYYMHDVYFQQYDISKQSV